MTTVIHEPSVTIDRTKRKRGIIEPVYPASRGQTQVSTGANLAGLLSHQILSCAAKVQAIAYLLGGITVSSDPTHSQVLSTLEAVVGQLRYLGSMALHLDMMANLALNLSFKPVNMAALLDSVVEAFQLQASDRCQSKAYQAELPCVWGDPEQLQIVLDNLISNALKYSAPQSPIIITAEIHQVSTDKDNGQMLVSITNFGSFIPPTEQEKLFIKFYRIGEGQQTGGYGLGLPLARWLVEIHGGQLEVESSVADGTTFWFTIPLAAG